MAAQFVWSKPLRSGCGACKCVPCQEPKPPPRIGPNLCSGEYVLGLMKPPLTILVLVVMLTGCIPLRQEALVKGPAHPALRLSDERYLETDIDLNHESINTQQSYMESPAGKRYTFQVQPHQYDIDEKRSYVSAELYPFAADGSRLQGWRSGVWTFHFVVETNSVTQIIDQKWKYWFFYYNPIIHGPPN